MSCDDSDGCQNMYYDQQTAILEAQSNPSMHPIFSKVNFTKRSVSGHSMGGAVTMESAGQWMSNAMYENFTAIVAGCIMHPGIICPACCNKMLLPSMWTTGTRDDIAPDSVTLGLCVRACA